MVKALLVMKSISVVYLETEKREKTVYQSLFSMDFSFFNINLCFLASFFVMQPGSVVYWLKSSKGPTLATALRP